ncbi:hypothetical protein BGZ90_006011 [Linnemannia elongata]|nr:hypothetical protein BGZ90_006011 [Linnemannia elongata]
MATYVTTRHDEAKLIGQPTVQHLTNWVRDIVKTKVGGNFAKAEGHAVVEALKAWHNKLIDQLFRPTSDQYSLAL